MSYATYDFSESLARVSIDAKDIDRVMAAWGKGDGMGDDAGHYKWSADGATDWSGGFLFRLKDGRFAYVSGWCDYTGWGCQDGAQIHYFDAHPTHEQMAATHDEFSAKPPAAEEWDVEPADLNKWLADGAKDAYSSDV